MLPLEHLFPYNFSVHGLTLVSIHVLQVYKVRESSTSQVFADKEQFECRPLDQLKNLTLL